MMYRSSAHAAIRKTGLIVIGEYTGNTNDHNKYRNDQIELLHV